MTVAIAPTTAVAVAQGRLAHATAATGARYSAVLCDGFTLLEMLISISIAALLLASLVGVVANALHAGEDARDRNALTGDAHFALQRMVHAVSRTRRLVLPLAENPSTPWSESDRDPGVLAVLLDPFLDRDGDGVMDADNDGDGLIDEDLPDDNNADGAAGILGVDDDGDGLIDEHAPDDGTPGWSPSWHSSNNDEDLNWSEELLNGVDDDGDGAVDEDINGDMDLAWRDVGADYNNDDGDAATDEDWYDTVVYHLVGTTLVERMPNLNPVDGTDYTELVIADGVTQFHVIRIPRGNGSAVQVDITLALAGLTASVTVQTRVRVGAGL